MKKNPQDDRWTQIRCLVVTTLTDEQQTRLLGQAHLEGRTEWSPYAKALFCFRWVVEDERDIATLTQVCRFTANEIRKNVKVIELMQENDDKILSNFSYYDVLVRNRAISSAIEDSPLLRQALLTQIKTEDFTAQEMRGYLPVIIDKPRILKKYEKGEVTLYDAFERAKISGAEQQLKKVRDGLDDIRLEDIEPLERDALGAVQQLVRQINRHIKRVSGMVETKLSEKSNNPK